MTVRFPTAAACLLALAAPASADVLWGVNGHPITAYAGVSIERQLDYIKDLGLKQYRVNLVGVENGDQLAEIVDAAKMRGIEILPVLTPEVDLEKASPEDIYAQTRKVAVELGTRFKHDIRVWELGNELENEAIIKPCEMRDDGTKYPCEWGPAGGTVALDYYGPRWVKVSAVLKGLSDGMAEVDPGIKRAIGTAGWGHTGAFARLKQDGVNWDISVWHMFGEDPEWAFREISAYGKPIWVTEFNNPYGSQRSERQQADGVKSTMVRLRELSAKYKVEAAHVYELFDETYWAPSFEANMGLVRLTAAGEGQWAPGEPKPAYTTVREFTRGPLPLPKPKRDCDPMAEPAADASPQERQASLAYCLVLGHQGDPASVSQWAQTLDGTQPKLTDMFTEMLRSADFESRYSTIGLSDRAYVSFLYTLLLNRPVDNWGMETYSRQLRAGTMTREAVAVGIIESAEFKNMHAALRDATTGG